MLIYGALRRAGLRKRTSNADSIFCFAPGDFQRERVGRVQQKGERRFMHQVDHYSAVALGVGQGRQLRLSRLWCIQLNGFIHGGSGVLCIALRVD